MKRYLSLLIQNVKGIRFRLVLAAALALAAFSGYAQQSYDPWWTNVTVVTVNADNTLTKIGGAAWNAGAASHNTLPEGTDGWVEFTATAPGARYFIGLSEYDATTTVTTIGYGFYVSTAQNDINIYESGVRRYQLPAPAASGDVYRMHRIGGMMNYYRNGIFLRSFPATSKALMIDVSIAEGTLPVVKCSFNAFHITEKLTLPTIGNNDGRIEMEASGGVEPYTYSWETGESTATITGKGRGTYKVTVTDDTGATRTGTYTLGYRVIWTDLEMMTVNSDNSLTKTDAENWTGGASAVNEVEAGKDGWLEFVIPEIGSNYIIGLSPDNQNSAVANIAYGVYISKTGSIAAYEKGDNKGQTATARIGDIIRISREGNEIHYYQNGRLLQGHNACRRYGKYRTDTGCVLLVRVNAAGIVFIQRNGHQVDDELPVVRKLRWFDYSNC